MVDMTTLQVICVNYKTASDLSGFLDSIDEDIPHITTVANVCPEEEDLLAAKRTNVDHHATFDENVGYARAVNYCSSQSQAPYIGIFNADVVLSPQVLTTAVALMEQNPSWGALGPRQVDDQNRITAGGIFGTNVHPQHRGWMAYDDNVSFSDIREDSVTLAGSALVVRRECWYEMMDCPVFRDSFPSADGAFGVTPMYYEETLFVYHLIHHGWKAVYYGPLKIVHKWHRASPVGGYAEQQMPISQEIFRAFCANHDILCD